MFRMFLMSLIFVSGCDIVTNKDTQYKIIYSKDSTEVEADSNHIRGKYTVAIVPKLVNIPYFNAVEKGAIEAGEDLGVNVIYKGPSIANSMQQIRVIEELIAEEVDVIAVSANDPVELVPVLTKAKNQGIKVITWDSDTLPEAREFFVNMVDSEQLGRHLMDTLAWNVNEEGDFAIMTGSLLASNLNEWLNWIEIQHQQYYPNMNLVEVVATDDNPHKAYTVAKELLVNYPSLKGIIGNSSVGPPAAAQAVKEAEKIGEVAVVGLSSPNPMNEYLKNGSAQIVTLWSPKKLGYLTVALAANLLKDITPYNRQDVPGVGIIRMVGDMVIMGEPIDFTKENVDQYDF